MSRAQQDKLIARALELLEERMCARGAEPYTIGAVGDAVRYVRLRMAGLEREVFATIFLDNAHRVLAFEEIYRGTLKHCAVYPREIVRKALERNAAAVVLVHNHPSGTARFSAADELLTETIREAFALVDVSVLDHLLVAGGEVLSYAEVKQAAKQARDYDAERRKHRANVKRAIAMREHWGRVRAASSVAL